MRAIVHNDFVTMLSRLFIGGVFVYASFYKIIEPATFAKSIWYYHLVPGAMINLMAIILPWLELVLGLSLIFGVWFRGGVVWANILTILFIIVLASTIYRGIDIDCGCFKAASSATSSAWNAIGLDFIMLVFTIQLAVSSSQKWMLQRTRHLRM